MANIPGVSGYIQPGVFARDRVVSRGVSIPGGLRIATIMGFGASELTLVSSAKGEGQDGVTSPNGATVNGRFYLIPNAPLQEGRTSVFLNGVELLGLEGSFSSSDSIPAGYDYKLDPETGYLGLQSASIKDQNGKGYSAASTNLGTGIIEEGDVGSLEELAVLDENAPNERWTLRCTSVQKDSSGAPIKGGAKFSVTGSISGQSRDSSGNPILFSDTYKSGSVAQVYANEDLVTQGYVMALGSERGGVAAKLLSNEAVSSGSLKVLVPLTGTGSDTSSLEEKIISGDFLSNTTANVYVSNAYKITSIEIDFTNDYMVFDIQTPVTRKDGTDIAFSDGTITVNGVSYNFKTAIPDTDWSLRARDVIALNNPTEVATSEDVDKLILIDGDAEARYVVDAITKPKHDDSNFNILRVSSFDNPSEGLPSLAGNETGLSYSLVETNNVLSAAINFGDQAFAVGDKFFIDVFSRSLQVNNNLFVRTIIKANVNDPELISEPSDLAAKHGFASLENNLSLGAALAFENGAPAVLAVQCKPSVPRKTNEVLLAKRNSNGEGGFAKSATGTYDVDDLYFPISEVLSGGYRFGKPDVDTQVKIFILRGTKEIEIFPNKSGFYNPQFDDNTGKNNFIDDDTTYGFSYTIARSGSDIDGEGDDGVIANEGSTYTFSTLEYNFGSADVGKKIVIRSLQKSNGDIINEAADIDAYLGGTVSDATLTISAISSDSKVTFSETVTAEASNIQFFIEDESSSERQFGLLLNKSIANSGSLQDGDGIKISYIDQNDADFFDTNWFESFEKLEAFNTQIIVPLPTQTISNIFRAAVSHCELMSSITNRKERVAYIGAQTGITPAALVGNELVAVENIGVLEGIQGDDPEEILDGNTEDLANYKLNDNFTTERSVYFYPDQIVRNINGSNTLIDGFYLAAAAAGYTSATTNVATPLTNKVLIGFTILRDKVFKDLTLNQLGSVGATVVQPVLGGGRILAGRTTSTSGFIEDEEISIIFIRDRVKQVLRDSLQTFIGRVQDSATNTLMLTRVTSIMSSLVSQGIIESYTNVSVERDKVDPRQINVFLRFVPTFPINFVFIDIEVGIS